MSQGSLGKLKQSWVQSINSLKDEITNPKNIEKPENRIAI